MKKNIINLLILIALIVVILVKLSENKKIADQRVYHYDPNQPILVHSMPVKSQALVIDRNYTGNFVSEKDGKINAEVPGKIMSIKVNEGDYVRKGQLLIKIDPTLLLSKKRALDIKIKGLQDDVKRYTALVKADAVQAIKLEKAQLGLKAAKAERQSVIEQLAKTNIRAPFSGHISHKFTEVGSYAAPGMPLLELTDIARLQFVVNVSEDDLDLFDYNKNYPIQISALPGQKTTGKLAMIASKANPSNDYPVKFDVNNTKDKSIKSGMFGNIFVQKDFGENVIVIPATAVMGSEQEPKVYVIENGKARLKNIVIAKHLGNDVVIKDGLNAGEVIVTSGFINLFDDANVTTKEK
jgi:RND family efflux transporter MFP subunit